VAMLQELLEKLEFLKASDLYISVGLPATVKLNGELTSLTDQPFDENEVYDLLKEAMGEKRFAYFENNKDANYALDNEQIGRFRISAFMQKERPGMVIRRIEAEIPTFETLHLPVQLKESCLKKRGLILFVGPAGSGKSTTQAAMIGYRNQTLAGHILTIEDPIEFVHEHQTSIITQREIGIDTDSFTEALKNALLQAPDVMVIGEIRTRETLEFALAFVETDRLCMATLHANNANQALDRLLHLMPQDRHRQLLFDLSVNLLTVVAHQSIVTPDGKERYAALEILYNTEAAADAIRKGEFHLLKDVMKHSDEYGMQTFDQALFKLYDQGVIGYTETLAHADSSNDVRLMIKTDATSQSKSLGSNMFDDITLDY